MNNALRQSLIDLLLASGCESREVATELASKRKQRRLVDHRSAELRQGRRRAIYQ
ncbi:MAG: hypothetical protein QM796_11950 [Chthoniobacteraceae bacterium]